MANPRLTKEQREQLFAPLLERVKADLHKLSEGDARVMWALRRKLAKELVYIERGTPRRRNKLKALIGLNKMGTVPCVATPCN